MAERRDGPYVWLTWLAQWMSGQNTCEWSVWFRANWQDYERVDDETDWASYRARHTKLLRETHRALNDEGYRVKRENQNRFAYRHEASTEVVVGGKPDLVALGEHDNIVLDTKTGRAHDWHEFQVLIPMALLPQSNLVEHHERRFRGRLVYEDGVVRNFDQRQADDILEQLPYFLDILGGSEEGAMRIPSWQECRYCPISKTHCPDRVESDPGDWDAGG